MSTIKDKVLALLRENADEKGRVQADPTEMRKVLGLSGHDMAKNLHQLYQQGHIDMKWRKQGSHWRIKRIRVL